MSTIDKDRLRQKTIRVCWACGAWLVTAAAMAAPSDFRVLTDDLTDKGDIGVEIQSSFARSRGDPGEASAQVAQGLAEIAYGLGKQWELSLQLPASRAAGTTYGNGANIELTFLAAHDGDGGLYWGGRVELGRAKPIGEKADWETEWRPILGYRRGDWHAVVNAGLTAALTGSGRKVNFDPSAKLSCRTVRSVWFGLEYYLDAGPLSHLRPSGQRQELGLLVLDAKFGNVDVNLGVGKGLTSASDKGVLKLLVAFALD